MPSMCRTSMRQSSEYSIVCKWYGVGALVELATRPSCSRSSKTTSTLAFQRFCITCHAHRQRLTPKHLPIVLLRSLQNKSQIGKVDEILGPINEVYFTVKMDPGMVAGSFKPDDKVYIGGDKLLPVERFLPKPKVVQKGECSLHLS